MDDRETVKRWLTRFKQKETLLAQDIRETFDYIAQCPGWTFEYVRPSRYNLTKQNAVGFIQQAYGLNVDWIFNQDGTILDVVKNIVAGKSNPDIYEIQGPFLENEE